LRTVCEIRERFHRDDDMDKVALQAILNRINTQDQTYEKTEMKAIEDGKAFLEEYRKQNRNNVHYLKSPDPLVEMKLVPSSISKMAPIGVVTTVVDTSVEECATNELVGLNSRERRRTQNARGITDSTIININGHSL